MALLSCLRCATRFAVGLLHCPHCLSEDFEEADVPKNTTWGGASYPQEPGAAEPQVPVVPEVPAAEPEEPAAEVSAETPDPDPAPKDKAAKPAPTLT